MTARFDNLMMNYPLELARWAVPDGVEIIAAVAKTSVGKFDKKVLRERYNNWVPGVI